MNFKLLVTVFISIFIAELGDKTQLATLLFASNKMSNKLTIFIGSALALVLTSAIGVFAGSILSEKINTKYLSWAAGICFIIVGIWTIMMRS